MKKIGWILVKYCTSHVQYYADFLLNFTLELFSFLYIYIYMCVCVCVYIYKVKMVNTQTWSDDHIGEKLTVTKRCWLCEHAILN